MKHFCLLFLVAACRAAIIDIGLGLGGSSGETDKMSFGEQKLGKFFDVHDADGNGRMELADYKAIGDCYLSSAGYDRYSSSQIHENKDVAAFNAIPSEPMDKSQFLKNMTSRLSSDPFIIEAINNIAKVMFGVMNYENGGNDTTLSQKELELGFKCWRSDPSKVGIAFRSIDLNKDGLIADLEFSDSLVMFFISKDKTDPSMNFFGPLTSN